MTEHAVPSKGRPDYGTDASTLQRVALYGGVALVVAGRMLNERGVMQSLDWLAAAGGVMIWMGLAFFLLGCLLLLRRKAGKSILREGMLNSISWRGDEQVLDVGCGRGLLLVGAAKRLQTGRAVGVDAWPAPQAGHNHNGAEAVMENARIEGVAERIELKAADFQELPLPDASIDVILSSLAIQSIDHAAGREGAIREMARVLKPGGQLAVADTRYTQEYEQFLHSLGWEQTQCLSPGPSFVTPARVLRAVKP
jgi:arsenite methyltransferase